MRRARPLYRARQFWAAFRANPKEEDLDLARQVLTPTQMGLFRNMHPADKSHALRVLKRLQARGEDNHDLLVAALLHDVGKVRHPLALWERILIVLGRAIFRERVREWGLGKPRGWKRPFVIAEQHPYWGAQMAAECGASSLAINLIWRHQEPPSTLPKSLEDRLLRALQSADEDS
jgi:hypothetical protein